MGRESSILRAVLGKISGWPSRVFCILFLLCQSSILDYYLIKYHNLQWLAWISADLLVLGLFVVTFFISHKFLRKKTSEKAMALTSRGGELPLAWITWLVYSVVLSAKIIIIFNGTAQQLSTKTFLGPNTLKVTIALTMNIFFLLLFTQHSSPYNSEARLQIESLASSVPIDIIDTVTILDTLFIQETHLFLSFRLHHGVQAVAAANLILPTVLLMMLSSTQYGHSPLSHRLHILHSFGYVCFVNIPLFIIRLVIWHGHDQNVSVFILKNAFSIVKSVVQMFAECKLVEDETDSAGPERRALNKGENLELRETTSEL